MSESSSLPDRWLKAEIVGKISAGLLIPIVILIAGAWFTRQQEEVADARRNSDRVAQLLTHLASEEPQERILAIQALSYHQAIHDMPPEIVESLVTTAATDDVNVAAAAITVLGTEKQPEIERQRLLLELLGPMMIHFDRTRSSFEVWSGRTTFLATGVIHDSNKAVRSLLINKAELIPQDLVMDAIALVEHYDAWLLEYKRVQREQDTPYVFVGPQGFPFPKDSEKRFRERYDQLVQR